MVNAVKTWARVSISLFLNAALGLFFVRRRSEKSQIKEHAEALKWLVIGGRRELVRQRAKRMLRFYLIGSVIYFIVVRLARSWLEENEREQQYVQLDLKKAAEQHPSLNHFQPRPPVTDSSAS